MTASSTQLQSCCVFCTPLVALQTMPSLLNLQQNSRVLQGVATWRSVQSVPCCILWLRLTHFRWCMSHPPPIGLVPGHGPPGQAAAGCRPQIIPTLLTAFLNRAAWGLLLWTCTITAIPFLNWCLQLSHLAVWAVSPLLQAMALMAGASRRQPRSARLLPAQSAGNPP